MQLDPTGVWVDPGAMDENYGREYASDCQDEMEWILAPDEVRYLERNPIETLEEVPAIEGDPTMNGIQEANPTLPLEPAPAPPLDAPRIEEPVIDQAEPPLIPSPTTTLPISVRQREAIRRGSPSDRTRGKSAKNDRNTRSESVLRVSAEG